MVSSNPGFPLRVLGLCTAVLAGVLAFALGCGGGGGGGSDSDIETFDFVVDQVDATVTVRNSATNEPIPGAEVEIFVSRPDTADEDFFGFTDANGFVRYTESLFERFTTSNRSQAEGPFDIEFEGPVFMPFSVGTPFSWTFAFSFGGPDLKSHPAMGFFFPPL